MKYKIVRLDSRYAGNSWFNYRLEFTDIGDQKFKHFQELRNWLWETFGPSYERDLVFILRDRTNGYFVYPKWVWHYTTKENKPYIYVADDATLAHLQLRWSA